MEQFEGAREERISSYAQAERTPEQKVEVANVICSVADELLSGEYSLPTGRSYRANGEEKIERRVFVREKEHLVSVYDIARRTEALKDAYTIKVQHSSRLHAHELPFTAITEIENYHYGSPQDWMDRDFLPDGGVTGSHMTEYDYAQLCKELADLQSHFETLQNTV